MDKTFSRALIIGAGVAGRELLVELKKAPLGYKIVGFIDDVSKGKVNGLPILGEVNDINFLIKKHNIDEILIAIPSASGQTVRRILESARGSRMKFKIVPRTLEIVQGEVNLYQLRDVEIADLLGRAIVRSKQPLFGKEFKDKRVLVSGAAGSIGSELCRQLIQFSPNHLTAFDWSENGLFELNMELGELNRSNSFDCALGSIQDLTRLRHVTYKLRPHFIFHAAAFKHIPLTQNNPLEAIKNNIFGTLNVAKVASEIGVKKFIFISSDKAADPASIMGATKLVGEQIVSKLNRGGETKYSVVRFGNVLESSGSVIPIFRKQIADGGPVTVTDPRMTRFMMSIPEAVQLVLDATVLTKGGEIFMFHMGEQIKIDQLARFMIQLAGLLPNKDIEIKYVGARVGEKLEEQLIGQNEESISTSNEMIFEVKRQISNITNSHLLKLKVAISNNDTKEALLVLKKLVPSLN